MDATKVLGSEFTAEELASLLELWPTFDLANPVEPFPSPSGWEQVSEADLGLGSMDPDRYYFRSEISSGAGIRLFQNGENDVALNFTGVSFSSLQDVFAQAMPTPAEVTTDYADSFSEIYTAVLDAFPDIETLYVTGNSVGAVAVNQLAQSFDTHFAGVDAKFLALGTEYVTPQGNVTNLGATNDWLFGSYNEFLEISASTTSVPVFPTFADLFFFDDDDAQGFLSSPLYSPMFDLDPHVDRGAANDWYFYFSTPDSVTFNIDDYFDGHINSNIIDATLRVLMSGAAAAIKPGDSVVIDFINGDVEIDTANSFIRFDPAQPIYVIGENETDETDIFKGSEHGEFIYGLSGNDTFIGGAGNDTLDGGQNDDTVDYAQDGGSLGVTVNLAAATAIDTHGDADTLISIERVIGTDEGDTIYGAVAHSVTLEGNAGDDELWGYFSSGDVLDGGSGVNLLASTGGSATIVGGDDADYVLAAYGDNEINTGDGNDQVYVQFGTNAIDLGDGFNLLLSLDLFDPAASDAIAWSADTVTGGASDDYIYSGRGEDTLSGGAGNDWLAGGGWNDTLTGGDGFDRFIFGDETGFDTITDFTDGEDFLDFTTSSLVNDFNDLFVAQLGTDLAVSWNGGMSGTTLLGIDLIDFGGTDILV